MTKGTKDLQRRVWARVKWEGEVLCGCLMVSWIVTLPIVLIIEPLRRGFRGWLVFGAITLGLWIYETFVQTTSKSDRQRQSEHCRDETDEPQEDRIISDFINTTRTTAIETGVMARENAERVITPSLLEDLASLPQREVKIVGEYGDVLAELTGPLRPMSKLPYPKETIRRAIEKLLSQSQNPEYRGLLQTVLIALDDFVPDEEVPLDKEENRRKWLMVRCGVKS